jgi:hypothetical protein
MKLCELMLATFGFREEGATVIAQVFREMGGLITLLSRRSFFSSTGQTVLYLF